MGMSGQSGQSDPGGGPMAEINITPFVDVMLVLLIIFMVAAPLLESGIAIQLPKAAAPALPKSDESPVTLNIMKDSRIYLNKEEIPLNQLSPKLRAFYAKRANKDIYIRADGSLPYDFVMKAIAVVKSAGISKLGLVTEPPDNSSK